MIENTGVRVSFARIVKIFVFPKYLSSSRFSLNVGCMNLYLISSEFGLCLIGSETSGIEDFCLKE